MRAVDVSNSSYFQQLHLDGRLILDERHAARDMQMSLDEPSTLIVARSDSGPSDVTTSSTAGLPSPFDTSIGNNFTQTSCTTFFTSFLNNGTFQSCLPISLLLQNSLSFFQAVRSLSTLDKTIDASCGASLDVCSPVMSHFATQLVSEDNCGSDYQLQNPIVTQAYAGLLAYEPIYKASCLKDNSTGQYCFAEALTNSSASANSYPYYTAIGISLPSQSQATCDPCLKQTMEIFAEYAGIKDQPLGSTYLDCATQINQACGSAFASTEIKVQSQSQSNGGSLSVSPWSGLTLAAALVTAVLMQS